FAAAAQAALPVAGVYDENAISANTVDRSAAFLNGSGAGEDPGLVLDVHSFSDLLVPSFEKGLGGVVNFESGTLDTPKQFTVLFNKGSKRLVISQDTASSYSIKNYVRETRTPISGTHALAKELGSADFEFRFSQITGGAADEEIVAFGATVLGRNNSNARSSWTGVAAIQDREGHMGVITNRVADLNTGTGNGTDDAFFGFRAPTGWFITSVMILSDDGAFTSIDDLAFVTAVVPQPAPHAVASLPNAATPPSDGKGLGFTMEWCIVGGLWVIVALLAVLIWVLKSTGRSVIQQSAQPSASVPAVRIDTHPVSPSDSASEKLPRELIEFAKQNLVQELYSQRQALMETQRRAEQQLADMENWLNQVQLPLRDRIRTYEERIRVLEKELLTKDESVRELTRATLLLVRQKLETEKERERKISRFS
ncbi:MAG TPA: hypothetical protein VK327_03810, partial [Candidatus Paceibacterota bacterium]|nr:hypothetical protein [Candidatus Paceibacterota bacterium]